MPIYFHVFAILLSACGDNANLLTGEPKPSASVSTQEIPDVINSPSVVSGSPGRTLTPEVRFNLSFPATTTLYSDASCVNAISDPSMKSAGWVTSVTKALMPNSTTAIYVRAVLNNFKVSTCTTIGSYTSDVTAPVIMAPVFTPSSPSQSLISSVQFKLSKDAVITLYGDDQCQNPISAAKSLTAGDASITTTTLVSDSSTQVYAQGVDSLTNVSACTNLGTFVNDQTSPTIGSPTISTQSPGRTLTPAVSLSLSEAASVTLYSNSSCTTSISNPLAATQGSNSLLTDPLSANVMTIIYAKAIDMAANASTCIMIGGYINDQIAPTLSSGASYPISPAVTTMPSISFSLSEDSAVQLFTDSNCTTTASNSVSFFAGTGRSIQANALPTNAATTIYGKATDSAGNASICASLMTYTQQTSTITGRAAEAFPDTTAYDGTSGSLRWLPKAVFDLSASDSVGLYSDNAGTLISTKDLYSLGTGNIIAATAQNKVASQGSPSSLYARTSAASDPFVSLGTYKTNVPPNFMLNYGVGGTVNSIAIDKVSTGCSSSQPCLYIGGEFSIAGSVVAYNIVKYVTATNSFQALGSGATYSVNSLAFDATKKILYAGGSFASAGTCTTMCKYIAQYSTESGVWSGVGNGTGANLGVLGMKLDASGNLYAVGYFSAMHGVSVPNVAKWDGNSWSAVGINSPGIQNTIGIAPDGTIYVGGSSICSYPSTSSGTYPTNTCSGTAGTTVFNYLAKFNPTANAWEPMGVGANNYISTIAFDSSGNLYVAGRFSSIGNTAISGIAKWNASTSTWLSISASTEVRQILFDTNDNLYAIGTFTTMNGVSAKYIAKYSSGVWTALGSGLGFYGTSVALDSANNALYVGASTYYTQTLGSESNYISKWSISDSTWSQVGTAYTSGAFAGGSNIYAIATDTVTTGCSGASPCFYVAGNFTSVGGIANTSRIAKYRTSDNTYEALGTGMDNTVNALAFDSVNQILYAGGSFSKAGGTTVNNIAKWNGTAWSPMGATGLNGAVNAIVLDPGTKDLYVGGAFTCIGGKTSSGTLPNNTCSSSSIVLNFVTKWSYSSQDWVRLSSALGAASSAVNAVALDTVSTGCTPSGSPCIYAGGNFTIAGGAAADRLAKWTPSGTSGSWAAVGTTGGATTASSYVYALAVDSSGKLFVGGSYSAIGGLTSSSLVMWDGSTWTKLWGALYANNAYTPAIRALAFDATGTLYMAGAFVINTYLTSAHVLKFKNSGSTWTGSALAKSSLGPMYAGTAAYAMAFDPAGNTYFGGQFHTAGGKARPFFVKYLPLFDEFF